MKTIGFAEHEYVLNVCRGEVEISNKDYKLLENNEISMEDIRNKYELNYLGESEAFYDDSKFDSIEWEY